MKNKALKLISGSMIFKSVKCIHLRKPPGDLKSANFLTSAQNRIQYCANVLSSLDVFIKMVT